MTEALVWFAIVVVVAGLVWLAEPYHSRLIDAAHERARASGEEERD